jgi:hypothetical protein
MFLALAFHASFGIAVLAKLAPHPELHGHISRGRMQYCIGTLFCAGTRSCWAWNRSAFFGTATECDWSGFSTHSCRVCFA